MFYSDVFLYSPTLICFGTMTMTFGANIKLSRCNVTSVSPYCPKSDTSVAQFRVPLHHSFSNGCSAYSLASKEVLCRRSKRVNSRIVCVMSKANVDGSNKYEDGLTYKSAGVDIDAGSELVKRIAKMAPGIGGFGGLYPFGIAFSLISIWKLGFVLKFSK